MPRSLATVPWADVLSVGRGVLAVCLIPLAVAAASGALQAGVLTMALLTDVADGPVARAQGTAGPRGARIDSVADTVLFGAVLVAVVVGVRLPAELLPWVLVGLATLARLAAALITRVRTSRWAIRHTLANKASGLVLGVTAVAALASGVLPGWVLGVCAGVTLVSGLDEAWLACRATTLDADARGSWAA
jgi:CDP-diacylglycerol--glycerol-3-phosphate 3-phosphatidyltransferase